MKMYYDVIGDIHGCNETLSELLCKLGYKQQQGVFYRPDRKVIFLGDFIDRGPGQREVLNIVRPMIDNGLAYSVMGNHEFNAIAYATKDRDGKECLREHSQKNYMQHGAFLEAYENDTSAYIEAINWFKTLPLWLDLGEIRVIHACWDVDYIGKLAGPRLTDELLIKASTKGTWEYVAVETLLKGKEIALPEGIEFKDKDGNTRKEMRIRWWDKVTTYKDAFLGPEHVRTHIPDDKIEGDHLIDYSHDEPPLFLGHYWLAGNPNPFSQNISCTDYSVGKPGGKLVAYRWDGEQVLSKDKFVWVERIE